MPNLVAKLDRLLYPESGPHWDDAWFRDEILRHVRPDSRVLDLGAGAGIVSQMNFRGRAARVCGVDLDPRVMQNPFLDEAKVGTGESLPYDDETFDVVFADNVLEHLEQPELVFREACRVLKPGGVFLAKTPNKRHYVPTIARLTPHGFHALVNRLRGRDDDDTFPTRYRANTPRAMARLAAAGGLELTAAELKEERPEYLRFFWLAYLCGWMYERVVNHVPGMGRFRVVIVATFRKPASKAAHNATRAAA